MNKLSFLSSIPSNKDTYIYVLPTNSQKSLNLDEVSIKVHILDLRGNSLLVFPAAGASSDGVSFTLSNLANLGSGTYAIYLELLYAHHQEFYPNDSVKYITVKNDDSGNLTFVNMFTAESSSIVPPQDTKSNLTDVLHVHDIDLKSIITHTLVSGKLANVYLDQNDNLTFDIPSGPKGIRGETGPKGDQGLQGNPGEKGDPGKSAYQIWLDNGHTGTESEFLASLKGETGPVGPQGRDGKDGITPIIKLGTVKVGEDTPTVSLKASDDNPNNYLLNFELVKGPKGDDGKSAYQVWLDQGNKGTKDDFLASLKGPKGDPGQTGPKGDTGPRGPEGDAGSQGDTGAAGPKGDKGSGIWAMKISAGGNVSGRNITDLYNASITNFPDVNDLVIQPDGNVFSITNVYKEPNLQATNGGGIFNIGPALFSIKGDTPSEDDILAKTKQYVDDAILNGKW